MGALDAFEEGVVFGFAGGGALVWVVLEDLLAVGFLDLLVGGAVAVFGKAENGVVVLSLLLVLGMVVEVMRRILAFQSLASRCSIRGSSGSLISPSSSSSVFLTLARA